MDETIQRKKKTSPNRWYGVGNVTRDPETKKISDDLSVTDITLALDHTRATKGGEFESETSFIDVSAFGRASDTLTKYASKGSKVMVEGYLKQDKWVDKKTNEKRSKIKVIAQDVYVFLREPSDDSVKPAPKAVSRPEPDDDSSIF